MGSMQRSNTYVQGTNGLQKLLWLQAFNSNTCNNTL
ncbi:MAG: hypothetical protein KatS3mg032_2553 [Cyclobacteriaceae bacterium]|nr:MAG: hypothetical protein KatS3mg032_2553 [Cyclobacteriaceae bacterium]